MMALPLKNQSARTSIRYVGCNPAGENIHVG